MVFPGFLNRNIFFCASKCQKICIVVPRGNIHSLFDVYVCTCVFLLYCLFVYLCICVFYVCFAVYLQMSRDPQYCNIAMLFQEERYTPSFISSKELSSTIFNCNFMPFSFISSVTLHSVFYIAQRIVITTSTIFNYNLMSFSFISIVTSRGHSSRQDKDCMLNFFMVFTNNPVIIFPHH